jgi:hypothetical protein
MTGAMRRHGRRRVAFQQSRRAEHLARLSATVDPQVLAAAKAFADATGFKNSFSAYLNAVLERDNKQRSELLNARPLQSLLKL